ncbi:MAG TPA: hypothetical protein VK685_01325 [Candidatus Acidoferrum sp.]|nr:hypothetical protein [Candidatus Acidoferrum sp.]
MKFPWWRAVRGKLTITEEDSTRLRYLCDPEGYGDAGFPSTALIFPTEGYRTTGNLKDSQKLGCRKSFSMTIFNAANEKDAFAASLPRTQDVATIDVGAGGVSCDVASGGGFWTTFSQRIF